MNLTHRLQRLHYLQQLKMYNPAQRLLVNFYIAIQSVPCSFITLWLSHPQNRTGPDWNEQLGLQRGLSGLNWPSIENLCMSGVREKAANVSADHTHPGHKLFRFLTLSQHYRVLFARKKRLKNSHHRDSFISQAVFLMPSLTNSIYTNMRLNTG